MTQRYVTVSILMLAFVWLGGCGSTEVSERFRLEKDFAKAERIRQSIMINPNLAGSDLYGRAVEAYERVANKYESLYAVPSDLIPLVKKSWERIAELYLIQDRLRQAIKTYEQMTTRFASDTLFVGGAYLAMGMCYERLLDAKGAIDAYEKTLKSGVVLFDTSSAYVWFAQVPLRLARLKKSIEENDDAEVYYNQAARYYTDFAAKWPETPAGLFALEQLAATYADRQQWQKAIRTLEEILDRHPRDDVAPQILMAMGGIYARELQNPRRALAAFERILEEHPSFKGTPQVYLQIADTYLGMGKTDEALSRYRFVLENFSTDQAVLAKAQLGIARTYEARREWGKALSEYRWIADSYPLTLEGLYAPLYVAQWYDTRGRKELARVEYEAAVQRYTALAQKYPRSRLALLAQQYLSVAYTRLEKWRSALRMLGAIREQNEQSPAAIASYLMTGSIYEELGDYARAAETYSRLLSQYPNHPISKEIERKIYRLRRTSAERLDEKLPTPVILQVPENTDDSRLRLTWSENPDYDFSHYRIYRSRKPGVDTSSVLLARITDPSQVSYKDSDADLGLTYYYRVFTVNQSGRVAGSNEVSGRTTPAAPPSAPVLEVADVDVFSVGLRWRASRTSGFGHYKLYRSSKEGVTPASRMLRFFVDPSTTEYRDDKVEQGKTYHYRIYAFSKTGQSAGSNEVSVTIPENSPPRAVRLTAEPTTEGGDLRVVLRWTANRDSDFSMYRIYRSRSSDVSTSELPVQIISDRMRTTWVDRSVRKSETYYYKVVVADVGALHSESNEVGVNLSQVNDSQ